MEATATTTQIFVKNPSRDVDVFALTFPIDASVGALKRHLEATYPLHPPVPRQKLIFGGRLLDDNAIIKDLLQTAQAPISGPHSFHLVISRED
eukprot:CAMPEP_0177661196 /NCGR_PEP_ID=MMETSP0447-20121125/18522_1 /TAXON_ID=0 /ORGANISM="Stygamoeba regulata, Strain BSH-02190019" /LENGTH=92 /DNA_ID=CAMNT_0019166467 /DNA_START=386 /DNA_END=661 /DNA_ORIENTATION=+